MALKLMAKLVVALKKFIFKVEAEYGIKIYSLII